MHGRVRRLIVVIAGAVLVAAGGGFAAAVRPAKPVPFTDQSAPRPSTSLSPKPQVRPEGLPCQAQDLESLWPEGGSTFIDATASSDSTGFAIVVRNVGAAPCTLSGYPSAQGIDRDGNPIGPPAIAGRYEAVSEQPSGSTTIEPGEPAKFHLSTATRGCNGPRIKYHGANFTLDNGFRFSIKNAWLSGTCTLKVSGWEPVSSAAGQFWALEARIEAPSSVDAGGELNYIVELINITAARVSLDPCMVYTQILAPEKDFDLDEIDSMWHLTYRLNCIVKAIGPREVVRYQMRLPVPAEFPEGKTLLHWTAENSPRPFATVELTVNRHTTLP